jgi:hypothetical protein
VAAEFLAWFMPIPPIFYIIYISAGERAPPGPGRRISAFHYSLGFGRRRARGKINKLYLFVNNQFIPDGIDVAEMSEGISPSGLGSS